jgi:hypothetical protein
MIATLEIPDEIFRRAESQAAREQRALGDLVTDGLKLVLDVPLSKNASKGRRMTEPPVTIREGNEIPVLTNDELATLLYANGETKA